MKDFNTGASMYNIYFDDTGNTGTNYADPQQPIQGLWSVSIHDNQTSDVEDSYRQIVAKHFPNEQDFFLNQRGFELHAADIFNPDEESIFRLKTYGERQELFEDLVDIIVSHRLPVTGAFAQKQKALDIVDWYVVPQNLHETLFSLLYRGLVTALEKLDPPSSARLIGDVHSVRPGRADHYRQMLSWDDAGKLVQSVRFVESHLSFGIQLADVVAYLLQRRYNRPDEENSAADHLISALDAQVDEDSLRVNNISASGVLTFRAGWGSG